MEDFQKQFDESMNSIRELIDFMRIDPAFLAELLAELTVEPDFIVEIKS